MKLFTLPIITPRACKKYLAREHKPLNLLGMKVPIQYSVSSETLTKAMGETDVFSTLSIPKMAHLKIKGEEVPKVKVFVNSNASLIAPKATFNNANNAGKMEIKATRFDASNFDNGEIRIETVGTNYTNYGGKAEITTVMGRNQTLGGESKIKNVYGDNETRGGKSEVETVQYTNVTKGGESKVTTVKGDNFTEGGQSTVETVKGDNYTYGGKSEVETVKGSNTTVCGETNILQKVFGEVEIIAGKLTIAGKEILKKPFIKN
jgi:hypothetical protein